MPREHYLSPRTLTFRSTWPRVGQFLQGERVHACFLARNGIFHGLRTIGAKAGDRVLVPAFICSVVVEAIQAYGVHVDFYDVHRNCDINFESCRSKIGARTIAILGVHYFGFPQKIRGLKALCQERKLFLIEDCAHVLIGEADGSPMGSYGDFAVFSSRKFLPVYDGGILLLNNPVLSTQISWAAETALFKLKVAKNLLDQVLLSGNLSIFSYSNRLLKDIRDVMRSMFKTSDHEQATLSVDINAPSFDPHLVSLPMSGLSKWVSAHSNIQVIAERRRQNSQYLLERLRTIWGVTPLWKELPQGVCPWMLPVFVDELPDAHLAVRALGVPASNWADARYKGIFGREYPNADFLYKNLIFLPVHQNLRETHLETIVQVVRKVREESIRKGTPHD